jgi:hypothetical protein
MAKTPSKPPPKTVTVHPITSPKIKEIASKATRDPGKVTPKQTQELGASVMRHIEPRGGKIK